MATKILTWIVCIFISVIISVTETKDIKLTDAETCEILDEALKEFISDLYSPNVLYSVLKREMTVDEQDIAEVVHTSGYDIVDSPIERKRFACKLIGCKTRKDVAHLIGVEEEKIDKWYEILQEPVEVAGGVANLQDIAKVAGLLFEWAKVIGYPHMPFKDSYEQITLLVFHEVQKEMKKKHVSLHFSNTVFPVHVSPKELVMYLETAKTYSEFEKGVNLVPGSLQNLKNFMSHNKRAIKRAPKNIQATMDFIFALYISGVLNLP